MKKIILKILYFLSFVPVLCIIGSLVYFYFADGIGWPGGGTSTGFDIRSEERRVGKECRL